MIIKNITPQEDYSLKIISEDGRSGLFDVTPYLDLEVFSELKNINSFYQVSNGGYFVEWDCGADLSADTIEANLRIIS